MRYPQERKYFDESAAVFADYQSNPRFKTVDLYRFFSTSRIELQASGLAMLDKFTSAKNKAEIEADTAIDYVDSPAVSRGLVTYPGRWRLVSNKQGQNPTNPKEQGILQHLRLYRLTTILETVDEEEVIDFTMARLISYDTSLGNDEAAPDTTESADPAKLVILEWAAIHPSKVADVIVEFSTLFLPALEFSVDSQSFTGLSYLFSTVKDEDADKDGMKTIRFVVGRPEYVLKYQGRLLSSKAFTGYVLWGIPKDAAQTAIDAVIASQGQGISITPEYNETSHLVTLRIRVRDSITGGTDVFWGGQSCMQEDEATVYKGYTATDLAVLLTALAGEVSSGVWFTVTGISEDEDGLYDCVVTKHTAVRVEQAAHTTRESSAASESTERVFNSKTPATELAEARVAGTIVERSWKKNANCTTDVARTVETPKDQSATAGDDNAAESAETVLNTEAEEETGAQSAADGTIVESNSVPTRSGKFRNTVKTTTVKDQTATAGDDSAVESAATVLNTEADAETGAQSAGDGTSVESSSVPTRSGKFRNTVKTLTGVKLEWSGSYPDRNGTTYYWVGKNCTAAEVASAISGASLDTTTDNQVTKTNTRFKGLFDYTIVKRAVSTFWIGASTASYGPYYEVGLEWKDDRSKYHKRTSKYYIYWNTSEANNNADYSGSLPGGWYGHDGNQWKCKKVTEITFDASWTAVGTITS